ncbi:MAG: class I SAM-dependent methyltransferase [Odoribacter splanchnicus]
MLDIGCGGGQNVANFIKRTHGLVCGMDYSPTCVDIASRKNKAAISQGRASIVEANVSNIPFDGTYTKSNRRKLFRYNSCSHSQTGSSRSQHLRRN